MNNDLLFQDDDIQPDLRESPLGWKVMIVDDEKSIHDVTKLALKKFEFEGRKVTFIHAYSGAEANQLIADNPDTALILLDVVMEEDDSGLSTARYIRDELKNKFVRIILRTGQPGSAPEETIIRDYDINDYKDKTELTVQKLKTVLYSSFRSYRDLLALERNRVGLCQVVEATSALFKSYKIDQFVSGLLYQLSSEVGANTSSLIASEDHSVLLAGCDIDGVGTELCPIIVNGTGRFLEAKGKKIDDVLRGNDLKIIKQSIAEKRCVFEENNAVFYFANKLGSFGVVFLPGCSSLSESDLNLVELFATNISIAYDNVSLYQEIEDTQKEVIYALGTIAEFRSKETSLHVNRVSKYSELLALKLGLSEEKASLISSASPMHDIGKVAIPDSILQKPGKLTEAEFELMKTHSQVGYDMLKGSTRPILQAAATIAHQHQEKFDGSGYPQGLKGEEIHIFGRITAVSDVFDALGSDRCYKKAWSMDKIVAFFNEQKGKHFDPVIAQIFLDNIDEFVAIKEQLEDESDI
ncbi:MAG: DUF3369 domain-containing protein [Gammaproteobacteria bacterium]|nr:DUF3369 domain-containing protein [Gammaproteobacteria bacterium]